MRYLAPFLLISMLSFISLQAGETSIEAALEKARQRAGAPDANLQAKKDKARAEAQQKAREDAARKATEEKKVVEEKTEPAQTPATVPAMKPQIKVFTLKDGRQIHAVMVVELDDTYALKDKDNKLEEVKKADVQSVQTAE